MAAYDVQGKTALITGGARGIGFELGRALHARGASVALADVDREAVEQAVRELGSDRAFALETDVRDPAAVDAAVNDTVERFGRLDLSVANAGIAPDPRPLALADREAFERVLDINLTGVTNTVRSSLPLVVPRQGQIVVIASVYAFMNGVLAMPYAMSKAAVEQLGRALRVELASTGASATVGYFGFVDTKLTRDAFADPVSDRLQHAIPAFLTRRISAEAAGRALLHGIENRAPRVIAPRWWGVYFALRGILNPLLDKRMEKDERIQSVVREVEATAPEAQPQATASRGS
jgi:NAD(P)-dependent dehydrogenase (short-subunit alcohol dehydrogenase family)